MNDNAKGVKSIFLSAAERRSPEERAAYLEEACGANAELRQRVETLLAAHDNPKELLGVPPPALAGAVDRSELAEGPGTVISRYKLLQEIGEGGFGVVYMAEQQEPVMRKVALKIIKLGMDTRQVIARFEVERQALAMMDHPNIAKVLDAGATDTGRPYFVMDLVRGIPITEFCDESNLTTNERLELFVDVCRAVQHAHQKGIIHRDIKPTNVMVTLGDGRPVPKVIDFGIAKATQHRLTEKTLYTDYHQFIGTPQYMSPEQATMSERDVDTRTDVYSLGVLLYELLVGSTPFPPEQLREAGYDEICRIIRENDPPTPSRRLSTLGEAATTEVSKLRQAQPATLRRLLRGDLDWIVMKALEKDRSRRYETANDFAADVERYLNDEAVEARHPSAAYTFGKFARRNRSILTTMTLVASALLIGTVVSVWLAVNSTISRRETDLARQRSEDLRYVSDMHRAEQARSDRDWRLVRGLLRAHHPSADGIDRRGWEWRYLWLECCDSVPTIRHDHIVSTLAISPDNTTLVYGDATGKLIVWDLETHRQLSSQKAHEDLVIDVEFSPDGRMLASSAFDNYIRLWRIDPDTHTLIDEGFLDGGLSEGNWQRVAFSHDGKFVASGGRDHKVRLWDLSTRKPVVEIPDRTPFELALHPKGEALAAHTGADVIIWRLPYDRDKEPWVIPDYDNIAWIGFAFSPDGRLLAACSRTRLDLWSLADQERVHRLPRKRPLCVAFSPDSKTIAVGEADKTVSIWDTTSGEKLHELVGHSGGICCVRVAPDGRTLASSSFDGTVRLWPLNHDRTTDKPRDVLRHHAKPVEAVSFSPDGMWLATGERRSRTDERKIVLWDTRTWQVAEEFFGSAGAFSPDSRILAVAGGQTSGVRLWDLRARQHVHPLPHAGGFDVRLAFSPAGNLVVFGEINEKRQLWDPYERKVVAEDSSSRLPTRSITNIGFSPDGQTLAATNFSGDVALFDAKTLKLLQHRPEALETFGTNIAFSPHSHYFATADCDHTVKVWDVRDRKLELFRTLRGHTDRALCAAFSPGPDGILAVGCANGNVRLWDTSTWTERATLTCHDAAVRAVCFSPDGSTLVTGSDDTMVRILRAASREEVIESKRTGNDPLRVEQAR